MILMMMILIYLLMMGFMTMLESKMMGLVQSSMSVFSFLLLGIYQFYLDFFKLLVKGIIDKCFLKMLYYNLIMTLFLFNNVLIFLLILTLDCLNFFTMSDIFIMLLLEGNSSIFKMFLFSLMSNKFVSYNENSLKKVIVLLEGIYVYLVLLIFIFKFISSGSIFSTILLFLLFLVITIKMFSTPFDYLEAESELVNGISLELYGHGFLLWSLVEYSSIFNNVFFLSSLSSFVLGKGLFIMLFLNLSALFMMLFISAVFMSVKVETSIYFLMSIYCMVNVLLFIIILV